METESLALEAEQYRIEKRLPTWKTDDVIAESSASTLGNSINEHFGRWLYELFQNAEDAGATKCRVRLVGCDLLITDNGKGIPKSPPSELRRAVKSLSNPFVSTKQGSDNIGRKGIGFCSVYQLTNSPMVWSGGSGIGFSPERTEALLSADSSLSCLKENSRDLPFLHALLPFGVSQAPLVFKAIPDEELIKGTTVWLPLNQSLTTADIIKSFEDLDHRFLLTFKWLESISLEIDGKRVVSIKKSAKQFRSSPDNTKSFRLISWSSKHSVIRQRYVIWNSTEHPPKELLEATVPSEKDRQRLEHCDVSVIAGVNASGILERIKQPPKLFVYYPTEETLSFGVIAHGDFILDGSRKHLVDHSPGTLNSWLLDRLAALLIRTANFLIADDRHTEAFDLLKLPSAPQLLKEVEALLPTFRHKVLKEFLLPKADDHQEIEAFAPFEEFIFPDPNLVDRSLALPLLQNAFPHKLVAHSKFCVPELKSFVESYSGKWVNQETLRKRLESEPKFQEPFERIEWCKAVWLWLAVTLEASPALTSIHLENLKIVPSSSGLHALKDDRGLPCLVLDELSVSDLPKWIKIDALPKDFSLWLQKADAKIGRIVNALGIQNFSEASVIQAFISAIQDESEVPSDSESLRYIDFAKKRNWPKHSELDDFEWDLVSLGNIPVPVLPNDIPQTNQPWAKACDSYFGAGWGNHDLQQVIGHETGISWVDPYVEKEWPQAREFLRICGVFEVPKLTEYNVSSIQEDDYWNRIKIEFPADQPKKHFDIPERKCRDPKPKTENFGNLCIISTDLQQAAALLRLIKKGWTRYFQSSAKPLARFEKRGKPTDFFATNVWCQELLDNLHIASSRGGLIESGPLGELWVKGYETPDWAWHLFPRLNVDQISDEDPDFEKWILDSGFVRTRSSDIPLSDWSSKILPALKKQITEASDQEPRKLNQIAAVATNVYRGLLSVFKTENLPDLSSARVCWDHKKLRLGGDAETTWAVFSEPELEFWRDHLPVYLFRRSDSESPAFNALGYKTLDKALAISLEDPLDIESDGPRTDELQDFAA